MMRRRPRRMPTAEGRMARSARALLACAGVGLLAAGCGGGPSAADAGLVIGLHDDGAGTLRSLVTVTATAGDWEVVVRGDDLGGVDGPARSDTIYTPRSGTLRVEAVLAHPGQEPMASGRVDLDIRRDWVWGVDLFLAVDDPARTCFGCAGSRAFPVPEDLLPVPGDSLWLVWGGNSISDPVVY